MDIKENSSFTPTKRAEKQHFSKKNTNSLAQVLLLRA
jgi:hypothetical protein